MRSFIPKLWAFLSAPFRQLSSQDLKILGICMVLAAIFWLSITLNKTYSIQQNLAIQLPGHSQSHLQQLHVEVKGRGWDLLKLYLTPPPDTLHIYRTQQGKKYVLSQSLLPELHEYIPAGLQMHVLAPDTLWLQYPPTYSKYIALKLKLDTKLLCDSCILSSWSISPNSIMVEATRDVLSLCPDTIYLDFPDEKINHSTNLRLPIKQLPEGISQLSSQYAQVTLHIDYYRSQVIDVPIIAETLEKGSIRLTTDSLRLVVQLHPSQLGKIDLSRVYATPQSSKTNLKPGDSLMVDIHGLPAEVRILHVQPKYVKLK